MSPKNYTSLFEKMPNDQSLFNPQEMPSPFDAIKETDGEGREWWNTRKLASDSQLWQTLDEMTSMKILSRIEGDEERTKKVLDGLKALVEEQIVAQMPTDAGETPALQSISAAKIDEMLAKLKATGFTSYWA